MSSTPWGIRVRFPGSAGSSRELPMENPEADTAALRRLRRAQGQLTAVITMLETDRDLREVVIQLAATSHALHRAGFKIISDRLRRCILDEQDAACDDRITEKELEKLFLGLA